MAVNYRKLYEKHYKIKTPKDWDIHHIDGNRENNKIKNLIAIPKEFHRALHNWLGLVPKSIIEKLLEWYIPAKEKYKYTDRALGYTLVVKFKKINTDTSLEKNRRKYLFNRKTNQSIQMRKLDRGFGYGHTTYGRNIYDEKQQIIYPVKLKL